MPVILGESGGHTHSLHSTDASYDPASRTHSELLLDTLAVPEGGEAFLLYPEHGGLAIAPGTYAIGCQREYMGEWRPVVG